MLFADGTFIPERSEGLLFHQTWDSHLSPPQKLQTKFQTKLQINFQIKEGKTARYSGHCHRNPPLGLCLVMQSSPKSDGINLEIDLEKS